MRSRTTSIVRAASASGALRSRRQDLDHPLRVRAQLRRALAHRREFLGHVVRELPLASDAADPRRLAEDLDLLALRRVGEELVQGEDVAHVRVAGIVLPHPRRVRDRRAQPRPQFVRLGHHPHRVVLRLRHLRHAVEPADARPRPHQRLRLREEVAEAPVPAPRDLPRQLEVLALVLSHRNEVRPVEEDVGRLQHRVVEEARVHRLPALGLLLVLRHPPQVPHRRDRVEQPLEFAVVGHVRLREERAALGVDPRGHERDREIEHAAQQVLALVLAGDRVQVDDAVVALVLVDHRRPAPEHPEIVPEMRVPRRLDPAEHALARPRRGPVGHCAPTSTVIVIPFIR